MKPLSRRVYAIAAMVLAAVLFIAVNIVSTYWLGTARIDLTEARLYTVSPGTKATLSKLQEPVTVRFFFSRETAAPYASVTAYAGRVRDLLQEYAALAHGKLLVEEVDPAPFTPAEDEAVTQGLTGAPTGQGDNVYFGLVGTNTLDGHETIGFFDSEREQFLEYDLTALIYRLSTPQKPKLGIISTIALSAGSGGLMAQVQGQAQPFVIYEQLRATFTMQDLSPQDDRIPPDIQTLLVVHPAGLPLKTLYAIDQFVLRGGHAIVLVDPLSEIASATQGAGAFGDNDKTSSDLKFLFPAWGVAYDPNKTIADGELAQRVQMGANSGNPQVVDYLVWLRPTPANFNLSDPITANLQQLNIATAGALSPAKGATTMFSPLITSSATAGFIDPIEVRATNNPNDLLKRFHPTGQRYTIAARISGPAKTAFPDGAPPPDKPAADAPPAPEPAALPPQIKDSKDINVVVIADTDFLDDRFWVQVQNVLGQRMVVPTADNGALLINAVENMMGSGDLISLRTRERANRPFVVVDQIRRDAERRYLAQEQQLQQRVTDTEAKLKALQTQGGANPETAGTQGGGTLSKEQQTQVERFRRDLVETRASLRDVQANLRKDVESLGARLAFLNIALMPLLVAAAAFGIALMRRRRRARARGL